MSEWGAKRAEAEQAQCSQGVVAAARATAQQIVCSSTYSRLYFVVVLLNHVQLVWLLLGDVWEKQAALFVLEVASTVLLAAECLLKLAAEGCAKYVGHWLNRVDAAIVLLSVPVLAASPVVLKAAAPAHTVAGGVVLCARFCMQQLRLLCALKKFVATCGTALQTRVLGCHHDPRATASLPTSTPSPGLLWCPGCQCWQPLRTTAAAPAPKVLVAPRLRLCL